MPQLTYTQAVVQAICEEMRNDPRVFVMGEDVQCFSFADALGEFGSERIRNTPISEAGFIGAGIGAALTGMRPVIEVAFSTFLYSAMDQIVSQAAKSRYMFGGQASVPVVLRATVEYGTSAAAHHSDRPWGLFAQVPGLKIVVPTTPYDAKALMKAAIRDGNPILFFEDVTLAEVPGEVPVGDYTVPLGVADVKRSGRDLSIVAVGGAVRLSLMAAEELEAEGISAEIVDIRCVAPLDRKTVLASVAKTGRLLVVDPAPRAGGIGAEIVATVAENRLEAPAVRLTAPDIPVPFSPALERLMYPKATDIAAAARQLCRSKSSNHRC